MNTASDWLEHVRHDTAYICAGMAVDFIRFGDKS